MSAYLVLPGIGGSGPEHWQSRWEAAEPEMRRFAPDSWDAPQLDQWIAALDAAVAACSEAPILVAHSLSCLLVAHWSARSDQAVRGAFLVAMPDPQGPDFPQEAASFGNPPELFLRFPAVVVASSDDPYGPLVHSRTRARQWGASFVEAGALGHINAASGLGDWSRGREQLRRFEDGLTGKIED